MSKKKSYLLFIQYQIEISFSKFIVYLWIFAYKSIVRQSDYTCSESKQKFTVHKRKYNVLENVENLGNYKE